MALRAGYYGLKRKLFEKVLGLPAIKSIGDGLSLNSTTGVLSATGTTVVANPEGTATEDLEKLQVGSDIYGIPKGTDVEANPEGTATTNLTKLKVGSSIYDIPIGVNYSTNEVDTGIKWVDGKNVYKKTINVGQLPNATTKNVNHGINNFDKFLDFEAWAYSTNNNLSIFLPFVGTNLISENITLNVFDTYVGIRAGEDRSYFDVCYVTLYYTKKTT